MPSLSTTSVKTERKYSKLLNNLLNIRSRDQTIFSRVNNIDSFDISSKFGDNHSEKIISQNNFTLNLKEKDLEELLQIIKFSDDPKEIIEAYKNKKERLFQTKILLLEDPKEFNSTKKELIYKLQEKIQKTNTRWKQFRRKAIDTNIQDNIWPLHIATCFISIKTSRREIYAPLLLKHVSLDVQTSKIIIKSEDSWKINEKAMFLLNESGYYFDNSLINKEMNLSDILIKIGEQFNTPLSIENIKGKFVNIKSKEIKTKAINFEKGIVLGLFKPSGGHLRKTMMEIIENDEIDEIIDIDPDKSIYEKNVNLEITNNSKNLIKIQPSNFSQDKALTSSLIQDTIIWGPPGTGKSQVIANIIANILMKDKTAIIMSQKKAALDVLKKRLGKLSPFVFFVLNDNKMNKSEFYKPLQNFVEMIENPELTMKPEKTNLISKDEIDALKVISRTKGNGSYRPLINIIEQFGYNFRYIEDLSNINPLYNYPKDSIEYKEYLKKLAFNNNVKKTGFFIFKKYPKDLIYSAKAASSIISSYNGIDINNIKQLSKYAEHKEVKKLLDASEWVGGNKKYISDEDYATSFLGQTILGKIKFWKEFDREKLMSYKRFANAVRAGRRLPYKFANDHMTLIRELFPIIITTPETAFINWKKNSFDYAVIDESSQMFLEIGLPILYLSKIKILAGDTQQMQPSRWFTTRDETGEEEEDVVENAESLLDYAFDKGVYKVMLNQNYRSSSASLMTFSAKNFYKSELEVIDNNNLKNSKAIEVINIDGKWEKGVNILEAKKVIEITKNEIDNYEKTILLTFNSSQRQYIEKVILEEYPELQNALEDEKLMIRNIENIQGDEADLVIVSVVYDSTTNIGSTYVARSGGKNALNVAISRAKDKMIVIKSVNYTTIKTAKSEDFKVFHEWLLFLDLDAKKQKEYSNIDQKEGKYKINELEGDVDSDFEQDVIDYMTENIKTEKEIKLLKQFPVGSKKIDIALLNSQNKFLLGIEVDGYRYHGGQGFNKYLEDFSRQEFLENKGYKIFRIKEIDWKLDKNKVITQIKSIINRL
ncbi:MAG: hypothetical protein GY679_03295 [Mycoplasma sp.]|nr:hypothetical protein [Mycoplasma sp.]